MMRRVACCLVMLACASGAQIRGRNPKTLKHYVDAENGVSFQYSPAWEVTKPVPELEESTDGYPKEPFVAVDDERAVKVSLHAALYGSAEGVDGWHADFERFTYAVIPVTTVHACAALLEGDPDPVEVNGIVFNYTNFGDAGAGHSISSDQYTVFRNGKCFGFSVVTDSAYVADKPSRKELRVRSVAADDVMKTVRIQ